MGLQRIGHDLATKGFPDSSVVKESACNAGYPGSIPGSGRSPGERKGYPLRYSGLENSMDSPWGHKESDMTEPLSLILLGLPWWLRGYSVCLQCGRPGFNPWVEKIPWRRKWHPIPVLLPGKSHEWRSVVGYSPWGRKELDTTERLYFT